jgi:hypothetical protein
MDPGMNQTRRNENPGHDHKQQIRLMQDNGENLRSAFNETEIESQPDQPPPG